MQAAADCTAKHLNEGAAPGLVGCECGDSWKQGNREKNGSNTVPLRRSGDGTLREVKMRRRRQEYHPVPAFPARASRCAFSWQRRRPAETRRQRTPDGALAPVPSAECPWSVTRRNCSGGGRRALYAFDAASQSGNPATGCRETDDGRETQCPARRARDSRHRETKRRPLAATGSVAPRRRHAQTTDWLAEQPRLLETDIVRRYVAPHE